MVNEGAKCSMHDLIKNELKILQRYAEGTILRDMCQVGRLIL